MQLAAETQDRADELDGSGTDDPPLRARVQNSGAHTLCASQSGRAVEVQLIVPYLLGENV